MGLIYRQICRPNNGEGTLNIYGVRWASRASHAVQEYWDLSDDEWEFEEKQWRRGKQKPNEPHMTVDNWKLQGNLELMDELGMSESDARRMVSGAKAMTKSRPSAVNNKIEWCKDTLGMDVPAIKKFLLKNPWVLNYSSQIQLRPFTSALFKKGMDPEAYKKLVIEHPDVLRQARLNDISSILDGFVKCGFSAHQFLVMTAVDPSISRYSIKKHLKPLADAFLELGLTQRDFVTLVPKNAEILKLTGVVDVASVLDRLLDYGLSDDQMARIRKKNPELIGSDLGRKLNWWS